MANVSIYNTRMGLSTANVTALDAGIEAFLAAGNYKRLDGSTDQLTTYHDGGNLTPYLIVASINGLTYVIRCDDTNAYVQFMREYGGSLPLFGSLFIPVESR